MSGQMIVICAPSGTGKSTLISRLKTDHPEIQWSVSCTTRPMRSGEVDGRDYHFVSVEHFEKNIAEDLFVEWAKVHSNYYGTSKVFIDEGLKKGQRLLFDLDIQGADAMKKIYNHHAQVIFIEPPSLEELERRLRLRATDPEHVIRERIKNAEIELARKNDYDHLIMNDDVDKAYESLKSLVERIFK